MSGSLMSSFGKCCLPDMPLHFTSSYSFREQSQELEMERNPLPNLEVTIQMEATLRRAGGAGTMTGLVWAFGDVRKRELDQVKPPSLDFSCDLVY